MSLSQNFHAYLCQKYPKLQDEALESAIAPYLLSPHQVHLPKNLKDSIASVIKSFQALRDSKSFQDWIAKKWGPQFDPGNNSLFMSYDFHTTANGGLKLIEINTNASFLGLGYEMNQFQNIPWNADFKISDLKECLLNEMKLVNSNKPLKKIVITDDKPSNQRLYLEFVLYRELFKSFGFDCEIADLSETEKLKSADLIYNRSTDFYFEEALTAELKKLYLARTHAITPNAHEYRLLADKENFIHWCTPEFWNEVSIEDKHREVIQSVLPQTRLVTEDNKAQIWSERKSLFFKPKRAFGSKSAFKGASISHKAFESLVQNESLAQDLVPAPELILDTPTGKQVFRYDIRCYAYRDQYQGTIGRIYQGQVTNLRTEGGGFAPVIFD